MRNRTLALELLNVLNGQSSHKSRSIKELVSQNTLPLRVLETDSFSSISKLLKNDSNLVRSSYIPGLPFGTEIEENRFNINLEKIDFPDNSFDVILTSDVAEHIRNIDSAHSEIYRVLRKGGKYIFTVPFDPDCMGHHILVDTTQTVDVYLVPKQLHGDPLTGGILAYRVFGQKIFRDLESLGFSVEYLSTERPELGIFGGDVFIAQK
ncbi:class I SAM-dependent methyltransferase [Pusillimonas minor]|uniref:Class I SAM-dependent methyltransferase n=1 Tax=Pusillimonas minor TaxID=2697024 RepID=A0A842HQ88_9BURK|nr:class I SAM-dependent methyltransferase [Pusillimonas minor]MBC2769842.1 class I SAM-dependent methyltransferase [Pusillimonas minor]